MTRLMLLAVLVLAAATAASADMGQETVLARRYVRGELLGERASAELPAEIELSA